MNYVFEKDKKEQKVLIKKSRNDDDERKRKIAKILYDIHELEAEGEVMFRLSVWLRKIQGR